MNQLNHKPASAHRGGREADSAQIAAELQAAQDKLLREWKRYMNGWLPTESNEQHAKRWSEVRKAGQAYSRLRRYVQTHPELAPLLYFGTPPETPVCDTYPKAPSESGVQRVARKSKH